MVGAIQKVDGSTFQEKEWQRPGGGGGLMSILKGEVFEKVGVNISQFMENLVRNLGATCLELRRIQFLGKWHFRRGAHEKS